MSKANGVWRGVWGSVDGSRSPFPSLRWKGKGNNVSGDTQSIWMGDEATERSFEPPFSASVRACDRDEIL